MGFDRVEELLISFSCTADQESSYQRQMINRLPSRPRPQWRPHFRRRLRQWPCRRPPASAMVAIGKLLRGLDHGGSLLAPRGISTSADPAGAPRLWVVQKPARSAAPPALENSIVTQQSEMAPQSQPVGQALPRPSHLAAVPTKLVRWE